MSEDPDRDAFGRPAEGSLWAGGAGAGDPVAPTPPPPLAPRPPAPPSALADGAVLAGYGQRVAAALVDGLVVVALLFGLTALGAVGYLGGSTAGTVGLLTGLVVGVVVAYAYAPVAMTRWDGQTVGRRVARTRAVHVDGRPVRGASAFVREVLVKNLLVGIAGTATLYLGTLLNYLWPLWDGRHQALHDKVCRTLVVRA